ncbi:kinase domain protein [Opisthorchis viverrini]|uniref:Kinase domain protein n=1 Tax=Opisthorchis viverrini TaxID=6198 RepID=A0A1S8WQ22_OPIVI|nr:kinase domain protein [Opisthorchis viverrini]
MGDAHQTKTGYEKFSFTNSYKISQLLGSGAYGKVFKGTAPNGTTVALKEIILETTDEGIPLSTLRELSVLKKVQSYNSSHLVQMLDISLTKKQNKLHIYIVFEFVECDLARFLSHHVPPTGLPPDTIRDLAEQLLRGTDFLHSHRIIHRDLKPANILIDREGRQLKIADFGLSRVLGWESRLTPVVVTLWYRAPEILLQSEYLSPCDIWAVGCIIAELFNCNALFRADTELKLLSLIFNMLGFPDEADWPAHSHLKRKDFKVSTPKESNLRNSIKTTDVAALDLLERMIQFNPKKRIPACEALSMPYFHPRPNTFPGLPFHSRSVVGLSSLVDGCATGSNLLLRPHRHSAMPSHSVQPSAVRTVAGTSAPNSIPLGNMKSTHRPVVCTSVAQNGLDSRMITTAHGDSTLVPFTITCNQPASSCMPAVLQSEQPTPVSEVDQHQQNLMMSVVKHAIEDSQTPSPSCSTSETPPPPKTPPQRPVTRQQTRATRRHTQPTVSLSSAVTHPTAKGDFALHQVIQAASTRVSSLAVATHSEQNVTFTGSVVRTQTSSTLDSTNNRGGRQRKTARRRTVTGVGARSSKTAIGPQTMQLGNRSNRTFTIGSSGSVASNVQSTSSVMSYTDRVQPEFSAPLQSQQYHRRLTKLLDQHQLRYSHGLQQTHRPSPCRSGRYSMEPSLSSHVLMPISEQRLASKASLNFSGRPDNDLKQFPEPLEESPVRLTSPDENILCSPSKQPRVVILSSRNAEQQRLKNNTPSNWSVLTDFSDQSALADDDDVGGATDTEDSDSHVVNTSLGINSAMTGLALVHRNNSSTGGL